MKNSNNTLLKLLNKILSKIYSFLKEKTVKNSKNISKNSKN